MQITLILLLTLPSLNELQNNLGWKGPHGCQLKHSFSVGSGHPSLIQSQQRGLQSWNLLDTLLWSVERVPHTRAELFLLQYVTAASCPPVHPWDKPLFILLLDFGSSALCLQQPRRDGHHGFAVPWVSPWQNRQPGRHTQLLQTDRLLSKQTLVFFSHVISGGWRCAQRTVLC